jgi:hypothetical protein
MKPTLPNTREQKAEILDTITDTYRETAKGDQPVAYISGPITDMPNYNMEAFDDAETMLIAMGFCTINPADNYGRDCSRPYNDYMRVDIASVAFCDFVVLLPGHRDSKGANREKLVAFMCGIPCFELVEGDLFDQLRPYDASKDLPALAVRAIEEMIEAGKAKGHTQGSWRHELPSHHLNRTIRHAATTNDLLEKGGGTYQDEDAADHASRALCRAAMAYATIMEKK